MKLKTLYPYSLFPNGLTDYAHPGTGLIYYEAYRSIRINKALMKPYHLWAVTTHENMIFYLPDKIILYGYYH